MTYIEYRFLIYISIKHSVNIKSNIYICKYEYLIHILFNPIHLKILFQYVINIFKLLRYSTFVGGFLLLLFSTI